MRTKNHDVGGAENLGYISANAKKFHIFSFCQFLKNWSAWTVAHYLKRVIVWQFCHGTNKCVLVFLFTKSRNHCDNEVLPILYFIDWLQKICSINSIVYNDDFLFLPYVSFKILFCLVGYTNNLLISGIHPLVCHFKIPLPSTAVVCIVLCSYKLSSTKSKAFGYGNEKLTCGVVGVNHIVMANKAAEAKNVFWTIHAFANGQRVNFNSHRLCLLVKWRASAIKHQ